MHTAAVALVAGLVTVFCALMLPVSKSFPYSDDWLYVSLAGTEWRTTLDWALVPHNEHFIPLMKLLHLGVLRYSDFDFRALIAINLLCGVAGAFAAVDLARSFRGSSHWGDLIAPLILLNMGFGLFGWAFSAQFAMAVTGLLVFLALFFRAAAADSLSLLLMALLVLIATALMGLNGLALALTMSVALAACAWFAPHSRVALGLKWLGPGLSAGLLALYVATRVPQTTPSTGLDAARAAEWVFHMLKSSFVVKAAGPGREWQAGVVGALIAAALCCAAVALLRQSRVRSLRLGDAAVYAAIVAHLALAGVIIAGRSGMRPWSAGLDAHYGYLVAPLPILAWVVVSRFIPRPAALLLGLALVGLYADAARAAAQWRMDYLNGAAVRFAEVARQLRADTPPADITARYMRDLFWLDTPAHRAEVEEGIEAYRRAIRRR